VAAAPEPSGDGAISMTDDQFERWMESNRESARAAAAEVVEEAQAAAPEARTPIETTTEEQRGPTVRNMQRRDVDGPDGWKIQLHRLFSGLTEGAVNLIANSRGLLGASGAYGEEHRALMQGDTTGAPWLPTIALNRIDALASQFGVARQVVNVWTGLKPGGTYKVPNLSGRPQILAINEASNMKTRNFTTSSISISPKKWGLILGFSAEAEAVIMVQAIDKMIEQIGESVAEMEDMTVFTADGTSTYHSITGILANSSVPWVTMASGNVAFSNIAYSNLSSMRKTSDVGSRKRGAFVFHQDVEESILNFQDGAGAYIFDQNSEITRVRSRPVFFTEALPSDSDTAVSTAFGCYGDYSYVHMGLTDRGPEVKRLDQATILNVDDTTLLHLALSDQEALRFIFQWDVVPQFPASVYSRIRTAAS